MKWINEVEETVYVKSVGFNPNNIKSKLIEFKDSTIKIQGIPTVLNTKKRYDTFVFKDISDEENEYQFYLLVDDDYDDKKNIRRLKIILKANYFTHTELLKRIIGENFNFSAYEVIGDIAHLNLTEDQLKFKNIIAEVIYFKTGLTVINKIGKIDNTFRFYRNEILIGRDSLVTQHKENGINFIFDLNEVYWCSRLQTERKKILKMVQKNQVVCDPFCGIGPHILPAIKKGARGICNDLNPDAIKWLNKSLAHNKLSCDIVKNMDAGEFLDLIKNEKIDHLIYNLPEHSIEYLKCFKNFTNFWIHVFFFCRENENPIDSILEKTGYKIKKEWLSECRKVSPSKFVMKLEVFSTDFFEYQKL